MIKKIRVEKLITYAIWLIPVVLFGWVIWKNFSPSGILRLSCDAFHCSRSIQSFYSKSDKIIGTTKDNKHYRILSSNPTSIDVHSFLPYKEAEVKVTLASSESSALLNLGIEGKDKKRTIKQAFVTSTVLLDLKKNWGIQKGDGLTLYTRQSPSDETTIPQFDSIKNFLENHPDISRIQTFQTFLFDPSKKLPGYKPSQQVRSLDHILRGSHSIATYVQDEALDFTFEFQELNRVAGEDNARVTVSNGVKTFFDQQIKDDGITNTKGVPSEKRLMHVFIDNIPNGSYTISVKINEDDGVINSIKTTQSKVMFLNSIFLADSNEYKLVGGSTKPVTLYGLGDSLSAKTFHEQSKQEITVDDKKVNLDKVLTTESSSMKGKIKLSEIETPKSDILFVADYFMFSKDDNFDVNIGKTLPLDDQIPSEISYVLSKEPEYTLDAQGWVIASTKFSGPEMFRDNNDIYTFYLESPQITTKSLRIKKIEITLYRDKLTFQTIWKKIQSWY